MSGAVPPPSIGERIERSLAGRVVLSTILVVALLAQLVSHLPADSAVEDQLGGPANHLTRLGAIETQWSVFAPNPRSTSRQLVGRVTFEDGTMAHWGVPEGARIGANLRYYRWRKWLERAQSDSYRSLWEPTCLWIASLYDDQASPVEKVQLVRRVRDNRATGPQPPYDEFAYFTCTPPDETP